MSRLDSKALGSLVRVELRNIWLSESTDFTPWLARPENLSLLGETLEIDLQLEAQEKPVGPFRADILCKDMGSNAWVLIENQLERTDHSHLGQLLTDSFPIKGKERCGAAMRRYLAPPLRQRVCAVH